MDKNFECKKCGKKCLTAEGVFLHIMLKHHIRPTLNDKKFLFRNCLLVSFFKLILLIIKVIIKLICYPFWWIYENL